MALDGDDPTVADLIGGLGRSSFLVTILVIALVLITPVSGIPTLPTIGATIVVLAAGQWLVGRDSLWLPGRIARLTVPAARVQSGLVLLDRPAAFIDRIVKPRFRVMTQPPSSHLVVLTVILVAAPWPLLEILPLVTSTGALIVACLVFGLMVRDGLLVLIGYGLIAALGAVAAWLA